MATDDDLQFDRADYGNQSDASAAACTLCNAEIAEGYFQVNGQVACPSCRDGIERGRTGGSGFVRLIGASAAGLVAAVIGATIYFAIAALTGWEIGLVAIVVGLLVGGAVRWGASGRGGWFYQLLAMFLTYCAIVATHVPSFEAFLQSEVALSRAAQTQGESAGDDVSVAGYVLERSPMVRFPILFVMVFVETPLNLPNNLIGIIIIGIALYEAWKINKRPVINITGPYQVGGPRAGDSTEATDPIV